MKFYLFSLFAALIFAFFGYQIVMMPQPAAEPKTPIVSEVPEIPPLQTMPEVPETPEEPEIPETPKIPELPQVELSLSGEMPVLMYHHVVPDGEKCNDMTVTPAKLRRDFQLILDKGYTPVLPREIISGEPLPEKPILITFDDGYTSNYTLLFPILQEVQMKAVISIITCMPDLPASNFCTWAMHREMHASGLVEIASHTYQLHNLDERDGSFTPGGVNGIQRKPDESDEDFASRVLDDLGLSYHRIMEELNCRPTCFAYPYGMAEPDAEALIDELFPVTLMTKAGTADLSKGLHDLPRWTVTMNTDLSRILE